MYSKYGCNWLYNLTVIDWLILEIYLQTFTSFTDSLIDWCCFYYYWKNSLAALPEALFPRIFMRFDISKCCLFFVFYCVCVRVSYFFSSKTPFLRSSQTGSWARFSPFLLCANHTCGLVCRPCSQKERKAVTASWPYSYVFSVPSTIQRFQRSIHNTLKRLHAAHVPVNVYLASITVVLKRNISKNHAWRASLYQRQQIHAHQLCMVSNDDDCLYYHSWRNNVVIAFNTLVFSMSGAMSGSYCEKYYSIFLSFLGFEYRP